MDYSHTDSSGSHEQTLHLGDDGPQRAHVHPASGYITSGIQEVPLHVDDD
jgi:hypothetical protein